MNCCKCLKQLNSAEKETPSKHRCAAAKGSVINHVLTAIDNSMVSELDVLSATFSRSFDDEADVSSNVLVLPSTDASGGPPKRIVVSSPRSNADRARQTITNVPLNSMIGLKSVSASVSNKALKHLNSCMGGPKYSGIKFPCIKKMYSDREPTIGHLFESQAVELENSELLFRCR